LGTLLAGFGNVGGSSGDADFVTYGPLSGWRFSRDAGASWAAPATIPIPATGGSFAPTLLAGGGDYQAADPRYGDFVAVEPTRATVSERVWYSIDSGNTWAQSSAANMNLPAITWQLLAGGDDINGSFVLYGSDSAGNSPTWRFSSDGGASWQVPTQPPNSLAGLSGFRPTLLAGSGDRDGAGPGGGDFVATDGQGVWVRSTDYGNTWTRPTTPPPVGFRPTLLAGVGDGGTTGTPPTSVNDFVAYGACQWYRSANGGNTWSLVPAVNAPR
jgi:hypothetical protein